MKNLITLLMLICITLAANAQAYVGGTVGIAVNNINSDGYSETVSAFSVSPEVGYYFNKTWAVGASVGVKYQDYSDLGGVTTISVLPYVRATFARASVFDFFGELALGYANESSDGENYGGFVAGIRPGFAAHLSDRFSLIGRTTLLSYSHYDGVNGFGFGLNSNFELGIQVTF